MKPLVEYETCTFCPRLCRAVCPIAVGSAREAATPSSMMSGPYLHAVGTISAEDAADLASLCTRCGACTEFCHLGRPVAPLLAEALGALTAPAAPAPFAPVQGEGALVAVICGDEDWSGALGALLGEPVASFRSPDHLGEALLDHPARFEAHAAALKAHFSGATLVVSDHGCSRVAEAAGLTVRALHSLVPLPTGPVFHPCQGPRLEGEPVAEALACCGAAWPLSTRHPEVAAEVAEAAAARLGGVQVCSPDHRCAAALRRHGASVVDPVSALLRPAGRGGQPGA